MSIKASSHYIGSHAGPHTASSAVESKPLPVWYLTATHPNMRGKMRQSMLCGLTMVLQRRMASSKRPARAQAPMAELQA